MCITLTNVLFKLGAQLGVFAGRSGFTDNCTVEIPPSPTGVTSGDELQSHVAVFRIGDGEFASVPGEAFPFTYVRSFLGPQDMPRPQYPLPAWVIPHMHTPYRFIDGLAEDMLGYIFPKGNAVGVPGEPDSDSDVDRFGCGHSDDSEAASSETGDIVGTALTGLLDQAGGAPERITTGRYVLSGGVLSRNPQGQPGSIKCNIDTVFTRSIHRRWPSGSPADRRVESSSRWPGCRCPGGRRPGPTATPGAGSGRTVNATGSTSFPTSPEHRPGRCARRTERAEPLAELAFAEQSTPSGQTCTFTCP